MSTVFTTANIVALVYFVAINAVYTVLLALSFLETRRHGRRIALAGYDVILKSPLTLPISVLMPAYNEAETIVEAVNAMRLLEYGEYEIIVIDDGSKDATLDRLIERFALVKVERPIRRTIPSAELRGIYSSASVANLTVVSKANGGKADALNAGINVARYPLFCAVDADAVLEPDALLRVVKPFMERPRETIATSGIVRIANGCKVVDGRVVEVHTPPNRVAMLQVVEYLRAFLANRVGWSRLQALFVISGAFGVFKTEAVKDAGGYRTDTVGEDMDLVLRLHRLFRERKERYRIVFIPDPVVWTEVPEEFSTLRRQRNRWHRGLLECLTSSRSMIGNPAYGPARPARPALQLHLRSHRTTHRGRGLRLSVDLDPARLRGLRLRYPVLPARRRLRRRPLDRRRAARPIVLQPVPRSPRHAASSGLHHPRELRLSAVAGVLAGRRDP